MEIMQQINKQRRGFCALLSLMVLFVFLILTSCTLIDDVERGTQAIADNRVVVESSTKSIQSNKSAIEQVNAVIAENREVVLGSSKAILENQHIIETSNKTIAENSVIVDRANKAIKANEAIISQSTAAIMENIKAVKASSEKVRELTGLLSQLNVSPLVMKLILLIMAISLFLVPLLMVVFMCKIHHDMKLLRKATCP